MNKYQEAFERLYLHTEQLQKFQVMDCPAFNKGSYEEDKKLIGELVEKATPKKTYMNVFNAYCPNCKNALGKEFAMNGLRGRLGTQYCPNCGQELDWSEEEND